MMRDEDTAVEKSKVAIVGFGRFGQFWAKVLSSDYDVWVTDSRHELGPVAASLGVQFADMPQICADANAVFLCVPINQIESATKELMPYLKPGTVVFDTCSVKVYPAEILTRHLGTIPQLDLVATHPMFGPESGAHGVQGLPIVVWPLSSPSQNYQSWIRYFQHLGLRIVEIPPEEHDRLAAYSQGVTHYIGRVLGELNLQKTPIDTTGFKLLSSVIEQTCHDTWELFHDLQNYNPYTREMRLELEAALERVYSQLLPDRVSPNEIVIGIQGGKGSFNEEACRYYSSAHLDSATPIRIEYLFTTKNVLAALHQGKIDYGVFAVQNAQGGAVMETIHALTQYHCEILDIFQIVVSHCILHHPDISFAEVTRLISHPQALAQCRETLKQKYPHLTLVSGDGDLIDQALCAQYIAEGKISPKTAVLASKVCADLYGLKIHDVDLQDLGKDNLTTFAWARRRHYSGQ